jgi:hypothetical protein
LADTVNAAIQNTDRLINSYIKRIDIDVENQTLFLGSYYELVLRLNRNILTNNVTSNTKIKVVFSPDVTTDPIWVNTDGDNACFGFFQVDNKLNELFGDVSPIGQNDTYRLESGPYVELKPNIVAFQGGLNDIIFSIPDSPIGVDYSVDEYMNAINYGIREFDAANANILNSPSGTYVYDTTTPELPTGTYAYVQDNKFNLYLDITKQFTRDMYVMDLTDSILLDTNNGININGTDVNNILQLLTTTFTSSIQGGRPITVSANKHICTIKPKYDVASPPVNGNENDTDIDIKFTNTEEKIYYNYFEFQTDINNIFANYVDPINGIHILDGTRLSATVGNGVYNINFIIQINKKLLATNYTIQFIDNNSIDTWNENLKVDVNMIDNIYDMALDGSSSNTVVITSPTALPIANSIEIIAGINNIINIVAEEDGVATSTNDNNIELIIPSKTYSRISLIDAINKSIADIVNITTDITGTTFSIISRNDLYFLDITLNLNRSYKTSDYDIIFYDKDSFVTCTAGSTSVQNTTWDTTIGWIMGFREYTLYDLSAPEIVNTINDNIITIIGDTGLSINLYNYFLICLDDYNQNHLNDGLVTITNVDTSIPLPSYANRTDFVCDPVTGQKVFNASTGLTANQIVAAEVAANSGSNEASIGTSISAGSYGSGPFVSDVFGLIPMKVASLSNGNSYVEFGGTLQNQERSYFGPVNIQRMTVRLMNDRGNLVDLNKANWSFSLICEQLNKLDPSS